MATSNDLAAIEQICRGGPGWITPELIREAQETLQPYYAEALTPEDAMEMLLNMGGVFEVLYGDLAAQCSVEHERAEQRR
jgi:hypothetical protein